MGEETKSVSQKTLKRLFGILGTDFDAAVKAVLAQKIEL
jgi:hypothetical protein